MNHYTAKSELQNKPPKVSVKNLLIEGFSMLAIAGVLVQVL